MTKKKNKKRSLLFAKRYGKIIFAKRLGVAQLVARYLGVVEAVGSSPVTPTNEKAQKHRNIGGFLSFLFFFGIFLILP